MPTCHKCKADKAQAMLVVDEQWVCNECQYVAEYPDAPLVQIVRKRQKRPEQPTLFPLT